jgi:hypothetical protein
MKTIKLKTAVVHAGETGISKHYKAGDTLEAEDKVADSLVNRGHATEVKSKGGKEDETDEPVGKKKKTQS